MIQVRHSGRPPRGNFGFYFIDTTPLDETILKLDIIRDVVTGTGEAFYSEGEMHGQSALC